MTSPMGAAASATPGGKPHGTSASSADPQTGPWDADVLVIGSGFGGSVSALRMAEKGYSVVVLEQGKRYRTRDFPKTAWSLRKYIWAPRLGLHGIQVLTFLRHALVLHGRGVGGGSLVYANTLIEPEARVFDEPGWGHGDWGARLEPHYAEARRMLGATRCAGVGRSDELLREIGAELTGEDTFRVHDVGVFFGEAGRTVPDPFFDGRGPDRTGCTRCGACMIGCSVGAKNTLDKNYLWLAERLGARIVPETEALDIRALPRGGYEVTTRRSLGWVRPRRVWRARRVVVSGGVVGTVRLLMRSKTSGGLPKLPHQVGRYVRTNSESILAADAPPDPAARGEDWTSQVAITSGIQADDRTHIEMVRFNPGSDSLFWLTTALVDGGGRVPRPLRLLGTLLRHPLRTVKNLWPFRRAERTAIVLAMQSTEGHLDMRLKRRWWRLGGRSLGSTVPEGQEPPVSYIPVANEVTRRLAQRMGGDAFNTWPEVLAGAPTTAHILGGCRMGDSPETGAVDGTGQIFGYPGLYVVDGSVVPVNLGVNPSLTITALAEYLLAQVPDAREPKRNHPEARTVNATPAG